MSYEYAIAHRLRNSLPGSGTRDDPIVIDLDTTGTAANPIVIDGDEPNFEV